MQSITQIPDIDVSTDYHHLRIKDGDIEAYCGSESWNETGPNTHVPLSMFLMESCKTDWIKEFLPKLESEGLYTVFAEHCVDEIEKNDTLLKEVCPTSEHHIVWGKPVSIIVDILNSDKLLKEYKETHQHNLRGCYIYYDYIKSCGTYMKTAMKKDRTVDMLVEIFRQSEGFEDFRENIIGPDGFEAHMWKIARKCITPKIGVFQERARNHILQHDTNDPQILVRRRKEKNQK